MDNFPLIIPSFLLLHVDVVDGSGKKEAIRVGLRYLTKEQKKRLSNRLNGVRLDSSIYRSILSSAIVFIDSVRLSDGKLTDSIESDIIYLILNSPPYFRAISNTFLGYLRTKLPPPSFVANLVELGEWQAIQDYGEADKEIEEAIEKDFGDIIVFEDVEEDTKESKIPQYTFLFKENVKVFTIFRHLRRWLGEYGQVDMALLLTLCKEYNLEVKSGIDSLAILRSSYVLKKQELEPKRD